MTWSAIGRRPLPIARPGSPISAFRRRKHARRSARGRSAWIRYSCGSRTPPSRERRWCTAQRSATPASPRRCRRFHGIPPGRSRSARTRDAAWPCGYWFNGGGESSATVHVNEDGTAVVATGSPDIGGSRASTAQMAAETLGIRLRERAADHRRHQFGRLHAGDRRLARHLRDRPRRDRRVQEGDRRNVRARREDLEDRRRGRDLGGRRRAACGRARGRVSADDVQGDRLQAHGDRRARSSPLPPSTRKARRPASPRSSATSRSIPRPAQ